MVSLVILVDCTWTEWSVWSLCDVTCGGGNQSRIRTQHEAVFGGQPCVGSSQEFQSCANNSCPSEKY